MNATKNTITFREDEPRAAETFARIIAELVRQGVVFIAEITTSGEFRIELTGGY